MNRPTGPRGATLLELLVVLAVLAVAGSITALALARSDRAPVAGASAGAELAAARREALATGRAVSISVVVDGVVAEATAWPDGSVRADPAFAVEPLTGRSRARR